MTRMTHLLAAAILAASAASAAAQEAYSYVVRDVTRDTAGPLEAGDWDLAADLRPMRVVQGPVTTWVVPEGEPLTVQSAVLLLDGNVPLEPGPGGLMVRGWRPDRVAGYDTFTVRLERGREDRRVAGRAARHYELRARVRRTGVDGAVQRLEYTGQLWVLPGVPHSWATFGYGTRTLPSLAPRLRRELDRRLSELGLVARAVLHTDYELVDGGDRSTTVTAFEVSGLERTDPPPNPGPVVDRSVMDAALERVRSEPGVTCRAVARGEAPEGLLDGVDPGARSVLLALVNDDCGRPELYFTIFRGRLERDPSVCGAATGAADPAELARAIFTEPQRAAFMEQLPEADRRRFRVEVRRYCRGRTAGR